MRILVCCDQAPFPPRNGVTIPAAGYIRLLSQDHTVDCLLLSHAAREESEQQLEATAVEVRRLFVLRRLRRAFPLRLLGEVFLGKPTFHCWKYPLDESSIAAQLSKYDVILATPVSALDYPLLNCGRHQRLIAAISDSYTAVLQHHVDALPAGSPARFWSSLRARRMAGIERRLLSACSAILVQTHRDREWLRAIGGTELVARTLICPNGVSDGLLLWPIPKRAPQPRLLLAVSSFREPLYRKNLEDFVANAWQEIKRAAPGVRLRITGTGLPDYEDLHAGLLADPQIELVGFVADLRDVYNDVRLVLAPIFKSYGYINKVAEAFAAGLPVVGDSSAFNGLEGSLTVGCAIAANSAAEFTQAVTRYLLDDAVWLTASASARAYAQNNLTWPSRLPTLQRALELV